MESPETGNDDLKKLEGLKGRSIGTFRPDELVGIRAKSKEDWHKIAQLLNNDDFSAFPGMSAGGNTFVIPKALLPHVKPLIPEVDEVAVVPGRGGPGWQR